MKRIILLSVLIAAAAVSSLDISPVAGATGKSLLLPGWGLYGMNEENGAKAFFSSEALLISATASLFVNSENNRVNALNKASYSLSKDVSSYPENVLLKMESYLSSDDYNASLPSKAREAYPDDPEKQLEYITSKSIPDSLSWSFKSEDDMRSYSFVRAEYRRLREFAAYSVTALALNHLVSAAVTYFRADDYFKKIEFIGGFGLKSAGFTIGVRF